MTTLRPTPTRDTTSDLIFLGLMAALSMASYQTRLGFYSDDWDLLGLFGNAGQSLWQMFLAVFDHEPWVRIRPVQILWLAGLYRVFGANPLPHHLVNGFVLIAMVLMNHLVARALRLPRVLCVAWPLVHVFLPHFSTDRFWLVASVANLSVLLYFVSVYGELEAITSRRATLWRLAATAALIGSLLAYEVALPLYILTPLLVFHASRWAPSASTDPAFRRAALVASSASVGAGVTAALLFKLVVNTRAELPPDFVRQLGIAGATVFRFLYVEHGLGLAFKAARAIDSVPTPQMLMIAAVIWIGIYMYFRRLTAKSPDWSGVSWTSVALAGVGVSVLASGMFLFHIMSATNLSGINNRTTIVLASGVALSIIGVIGWTATIWQATWSRSIFSASLPVVCVCGFLTTNAEAVLWQAAYGEQLRVLSAIRGAAPVLPSGSVVLLDGGCPRRSTIRPYNRALFCRLVFESDWDLTGALRLTYKDPSLRADVINPSLTFDSAGISTVSHGSRSTYPYGDSVFVFEPRSRSLTQISDSSSAQRYFASHPPALSSTYGDANPPNQ